MKGKSRKEGDNFLKDFLGKEFEFLRFEQRRRLPQSKSEILFAK